MTETKWSDEPKIIAKVIFWKYIKKLSITDIVIELEKTGFNTTGNSVEHALRNWGLPTQFKEFAHIASYDEMFSRVNTILGINKITIKPPKKHKSNITNHLVVSDFHIPYHRDDMITHIIDQFGINGKTPVDSLIVSADFFDCYSFSKYLKRKIVSSITEFNTGISIAQILCENFPMVYFSKGNHEERVFKLFANAVGIENTIGFVNYDWIKHICTLFPNAIEVTNKIGTDTTGEHETCHYYILGKDCAVCHFEFSGATGSIMKAAQKVEQWSYAWRKYAPELDNCKLYLQAHVHKVGKTTIHGGEKTIGETGCFCKIQDYTITPDSKSDPSVNAYWLVKQENGETLINESNYFTFN